MKSLIPWKEYNFMMCQRMGLPPISTIGFGLTRVSSLNLEPTPPARITAFIEKLLFPQRSLRRCCGVKQIADQATLHDPHRTQIRYTLSHVLSDSCNVLSRQVLR